MQIIPEPLYLIMGAMVIKPVNAFMLFMGLIISGKSIPQEGNKEAPRCFTWAAVFNMIQYVLLDHLYGKGLINNAAIFAPPRNNAGLF